MTPAQFKARFPEFDHETSPRIQLFIDEAAAFFDVARWDALYPVGLANLVAHELTLANLQTVQAAGAAALGNDDASVRVGDVSVSKDGALLKAQAENPYLRTMYGQRYLSYRKLIGIGACAV